MFQAIGQRVSIHQNFVPAVEACPWVNSTLEGHRSAVGSSIHDATGRLGLKRVGAASVQNPHTAQAMMPTAALYCSIEPRKQSTVREKKSPRIDCRKQSDATSGAADARQELFAVIARESATLPRD